MSESLTGADVTQVPVASTEPTTEVTQQTPAESQSQDTISGEQSQEAVSTDTATQQQAETQTQQTGGESQTDDGLAKFAESQGFDLENATDDVKRALKIAHDNQKAFRGKPTGPKVTDATKELGGTDVEARIAQLEYEKITDGFFSEDGRDRTLESKMVEILNEKAEQYGKDYAFNLSRDLDTLYGMAAIRNGQATTAPVDVEAIRREERESINKAMTAGAPQAHATQQGQAKTPELTPEWFTNVYDSRNPEHIKLLQEKGLR